MASTENIENAVKETKRNEDYKSPGRLKAEEKAERIRSAEEYRKKLEAENVPLPPKKTKAAEQKEQAKIEQAEKELAERKAKLDEETASASKRISDAKEKIEALKDKIATTEAELKVAGEKLEVSVVAAEEECEASNEPVAIEDLVIKVPVASFTIPCAVKRRKPQPAPMPPMVAPVICITNVIQTPEQKCVIEEVKQPQFRPQAMRPSFTFIVPQAPAPVSEEKPRASIKAIDVTSSFKKSDAYKPAITYGSHLCESGWDDEIEDEADDPEAVVPTSDSLAADSLLSDLERVTDDVDSTVAEIEKISAEIDNELSAE